MAENTFNSLKQCSPRPEGTRAYFPDIVQNEGCPTVTQLVLHVIKQLSPLLGTGYLELTDESQGL